MIFDIPEGWKEGSAQIGSLTLLSDFPDEKCRFCYVYLTAGRIGSGKITISVRSQRMRFVDDDDRGSVTSAQDATELTIAGHRAAMLVQRVDTKVQALIAVDLRGGSGLELYF